MSKCSSSSIRLAQKNRMSAEDVGESTMRAED